MKKDNLTFSRLIMAMYEAVKSLGFYAQRDTISDIAELDEEYKTCSESDFSFTWLLLEDGTRLSQQECDCDELKVISKYTISFKTADAYHPYGTWSINQEQI